MEARSAHLSEIRPLVEPDAGEGEWRPVRHHFGIGAFGVNAWVARRQGDDVIEDHDERSGGAAEHEELYLVWSGEATFTLGGRTVAAPQGTLVHVPDPGMRRRAVAARVGTTVLAIGAPRGRAFEVSPWERKYVD